MAAEGARVVVADVLDGSALVDELRGMGSEALALKADVSDETSAATWPRRPWSASGGSMCW